MNFFKKKIHASIRFNVLLGMYGYYADHIEFALKYYPKRLTATALVERRSSDTIFLLGSGYSINNLSEKDWKDIDSHDSFALNLWYKSNFVQTFWMWEPPRLDKTRVDEYHEMHKLLDNKNCFTILKNWHHLYKYFPKDKARSLADKFDSSVMIRRAHIYNQTQMNSLNKYLNSHHFHFFRGSLFLAICMARTAGYKKIVLCGVDMRGGALWEDELKSSTAIHNTAIKKYGLSMIDALLALKDFFLDERIVLSTHSTCHFQIYD